MMANGEENKSGGGSILSDPLQEAARRILEAEKTGAKILDLSKLGLADLPAGKMGWGSLGRLPGLKRLVLGGNQITQLSAESWEALGRVAKLEWLDLSANGLSIPVCGWEALGRISPLRTLYLENNKIGEIPIDGWQALGRLTNLKVLFLHRNAMPAIPEEGWRALKNLINLRDLSLFSNQIPEIPASGWEALAHLAGLENLFLSSNPLGEIPDEGWDALGRMVNLKGLYFSSIGLTAVPAAGWRAFGRLANLQRLRLSGNAQSDIPEEGWAALGSCPRLRELDLAHNDIKSIPARGWAVLGGLPELEDLDLSQNNLSDIPLRGWQTEERFPKLKKLDFSGNPLPEDLLAAATRGPQSLFEYLDAARLRAAHPRTVRLMLLGEPASGKTTLVEALSGNSNPCDPQRPETIGVNVRRVEKKSPADGRPLYLATWDFAGQHMEYATHQFFLKAGGIYLILWKARLGSDYGQRDLWYWLELLSMRVKDPEFLLVTTHTGKTPAALDLLEIQTSYPGCKGHFEVELCDGTGVEPLEKKILELAAASPSIKATWPAPWLAVRDAVRSMREASPCVDAAAFWLLCSEHEVDDPRKQRDLADQLDKLGEIVYYADDPLSRFVILDPTWVTELVAKVVRDKQVRDQGGTLDRADLQRIWGDLPGAVRDHLENLMDEFDLVYKPMAHQTVQSSIVVEALPPAPEEIRILDMASARPQAEVIYQFPKLVRHLPPGVPTWAFARSRRYMKIGTGPWRNAARFEDAETNSEAIVFSSEVDREVRLRVVADYPPYFFGLLDSILRDTFKRYPGAQPESRIPCPCRPGCKYSHPRETVLKRKRDGRTDISCPVSGEDVALATLLEGSAPVDSQAWVLGALANIRRQLSAIQNGDNEGLVKTCPSMFTLAPAKGFKMLETYLEYATQKEELELTLYCEWERQWHPTKHSVYRFRPEQEWFGSLKEKWGEFLRVTKRVAPLAGVAGTLLGAPAVGVAAKELAERAEKFFPEGHKDPGNALAKDLGRRDQAGTIDPEARYLLGRLIKHLDTTRGGSYPEFGGLLPYHLKEDGRLLWLCGEHREQYESARPAAAGL
jgi:Leucine-rich repeat (LRR) protein